MQVKHVARARTALVKDLKPGTVYTWGSRDTYYLRTCSGTVCLDIAYTLLTPSHDPSHFDLLVEYDDAPVITVAI